MQSKYPKILVISAWYPNSLHNAEGDFIRYQAQLLRRSGLNIEVFHASLSIRYLFKGHIFKKSTRYDSGLKEYIIESPFWPRNSKWGIERWAERYVKELKKYCNKYGWPEIIHAHTYLGGYCGSLIKKERNIPYLLTLHESQIMNDSIPQYHEQFLMGALSNADEITTVGPVLSNKVEKISGLTPQSKPNYIDFELFQTGKKKFENFTFIYIGELIKRKRVDVLIEAIKELNEEGISVSLEVVGSGPEQNVLKGMCKELKLGSSVHFRGRKSQKEVAKLLSRSHCLVLPSEAETFGIVLLEAMACGVPFISTRSGAPERWFDHKACKFVDFDNDSLGRAMKEMVMSYDQIDGNEIRNFALKTFNTDAIIDYYKKLYSSITNKERP